MIKPFNLDICGVDTRVDWQVDPTDKDIHSWDLVISVDHNLRPTVVHPITPEGFVTGPLSLITNTIVKQLGYNPTKIYCMLT